MIVKPLTSDLVFNEEQVRDAIFRGHKSDGLVDSTDLQVFEVKEEVSDKKMNKQPLKVKDFEKIQF